MPRFEVSFVLYPVLMPPWFRRCKGHAHMGFLCLVVHLDWRRNMEIEEGRDG